jgi:CubicO group peptidase (beta-lactamase class C family)
MRNLVALAGVAFLPLGVPDRSADPDPKAIDAVFAKYDRTTTPGCALGVYRDGRMVYSRGYGMADLNQGIPIRPNTVFYVASTSKQFAAVSIALAAEQGRLALEDPIRKYLPELPAYADSITVRDLVHHLSGIRDYLGLWAVSGRSAADEIPEEMALDLIARQKALDFPPRTRWSYSNSGYFLLSVIVKRATGESLRAFAERHIFGPLKMTNTHFHDDNKEIVANRAEGYQPKGEGTFEIVRTSFALVGDGGLYTTVEDLLAWDANFYGNRLAGGAALLDRILTPARLANGDSTNYAFGLMHRTHRGLAVVEHGGAFIGYRAQLTRFPIEKLSVAVLCNDYTADPDALVQRVAELYLGDRMAAAAAGLAVGGTATGTAAGAAAPAPARIAVAPERLERYQGRYEIGPGQVITVRRAGDSLLIDAFGRVFPLAAVDESTFTATGLPGRIEFRDLASGPGLLVSALGGIAPSPRLPPPPSVSAAAMAALAGTYTSEELDTWATVAVRDGALSVRLRYDVWRPLVPLLPDAFIAAGSRIDLTRGRRGEVTGFRLSAPRLANVEFARVR